ncbi:hypothetical protein GCM10017559_44900 [Streptosporangium longisporum]|uniref:Uncharacterized protein n=1 Tax=Streptosporangium longisporum TaxID=46187 RepID=A0ABN3YBH0_9ACTN
MRLRGGMVVFADGLEDAASEEGVAGLEFGPLGVLAGFGVGEDAAAAIGGQRVDSPFQLLAFGRDAGVADVDLGAGGGEGVEQVAGGLQGRGHAVIVSAKGYVRLLNGSGC